VSLAAFFVIAAVRVTVTSPLPCAGRVIVPVPDTVALSDDQEIVVPLAPLNGRAARLAFTSVCKIFVPLMTSQVSAALSADTASASLGGVTVRVKLCVASGFTPLVAVIVKVYGPTAVVLAIVIKPVVLLMLTPVGCPDKL